MPSPVSLICDIPKATQRAFAYALRGKIKRHRPLDILLAEDDPSDVMLTENALERTSLDYNLHTVTSGNEVIPYLRHEGKYHDEPLPDLILLDLSLPHMDGYQIMDELRGDDTFRTIPIIILTGDAHPRDELRSDSLWLSDYVTKPATREKILESLGRLHSPV